MRDLRESPPDRSHLGTGEYRPVAVCILNQLEERTPGMRGATYQFVDFGTWARVTGRMIFAIGGNGQALEYVIRQQEPGQVVIEARNRESRLSGFEKRVWPELQRCAPAS